VVARWQVYLLLRKVLYLVPHHIDPALVRRIQLNDRCLEVLFQIVSAQAQDARGLPGAGRADQDHIWNVSVFLEELKLPDDLLVAADLREIARSVPKIDSQERRGSEYFSSQISLAILN